jgi:hypothetical protein
MSDMDRRKFVGGVGATLAAAKVSLAGELLAQSSPTVTQKRNVPTIGIQIGAISFQDEGTEKVIDILQEKACVNALFVASFTYGNGIAGRQLPGHPFPDHGLKNYDDHFYGGNYATPHPQYYKNTAMEPLKAPDNGGKYDVLEDVIPKAHKRGVKIYTWAEDVWNPKIKNFDIIAERDLYGRPTGTACFYNPDYHNFLMGLHEDFTRSYDIDGIMWGSERYGPFGNMVESVHNRNGNDPSKVTCFCQFCQAEAKHRGIDVSRAFEGFKELEKWVRFCRGGGKPPDGHYVTLWRVLFNYPELLAWEQMWNDGVRRTYEAIYKQTKSIRPSVQVGWHVWHAHSFSAFFRAQTDLKRISSYSDYLKMTVYNNLGGTRMETYITSTSNTIYGDMPIDQALEFEYKIMGYHGLDYKALPYKALDSSYVLNETRRCVADVEGTQTEIWPGIDVDIANMNIEYSHSSPPVVKAVTKAASQGGGKGLVISRKYSEMYLGNLAAVGDAIRELKVV